jgi:neutral ceramidase
MTAGAAEAAALTDQSICILKRGTSMLLPLRAVGFWVMFLGMLAGVGWYSGSHAQAVDEAPQATSEPAANAVQWHAGAASRVITPQQPMWMAGYGSRTTPANGKLTELYAKALVLQAGDAPRAVMLTLDLVGIDRELSRRVKAAVAARVDVNPERIMICTSHTHSGPVVGLNLGPMHFYRLSEVEQGHVAAYAAQLIEDCAAVAAAAEQALQPATLHWGIGNCDVAVNRRNNKEPDVPVLRAAGELVGPVDHDVPVLAVRDTEGRLKSVLFGYACHATVLSGQQWCGDYPTYAQLELERLHPECIALFFAGCGGDQNPLPRRTPQLAEHYGRRLAAAVETVLLTSTMHAAAPALHCTEVEVELPLAELPTLEQLKQTRESTNEYEASRAALLLQQLESGQALRQSYPYPIALWRIGKELNLVALGGEVVVDYALRLKHELQGPTFVAAYANDVMAYIPSRRVLAEGGYEGGGSMVYYGLPAFWAPEVEEFIVGGARTALDRVEKLVAQGPAAAGASARDAAAAVKLPRQGTSAPGGPVQLPGKGEMFPADATLEVISQAGRGGEGPAWDPELGILTSGNGHINRRAPDGTLSIFRSDAGTNGLLFDRDGSLLACEPAARRVTRTARDGTVTVITDNYRGAKYNTPNDLTLDSRGRLYFSDARYGTREDMQIRDADGRTIEGVFRVDLDGTVSLVVGREVQRANGVLVTAQDRFLYVADNNNDMLGGARKLWRFGLTEQGTVVPGSQQLVFDWGQGRGPDGLKHDVHGNLYVAAGTNAANPPFEPDNRYPGGIYVFSPEGAWIAYVNVPTDEVTNCAFGDADLRSLYITGGGTLYRIRTTHPGLVVWPAK